MTKGKFHEYQSQFLSARRGARVGSRACLVRSRYGSRYLRRRPQGRLRCSSAASERSRHLFQGLHRPGQSGCRQHLDRRLTTPTISRVHHRTSSRARCSASASAGRRATGCASTSPVNIAATRSSSARILYPAIGGFDAGTNEYTADIKSWLGLANAYIDMGNWCGFTPYIGAGIGFATITVDGMKDVNVPAEQRRLRRHQDATPTSPGPSTPASATTSRRSRSSTSPTAMPTSALRRAASSRPTTARSSISGVIAPRHHLERRALRLPLQAAARERSSTSR